MRWKSHVRFGGRTGETGLLRDRNRALVRSHLANQKLDECRRRVQQELFGHRGHKLDPLYRARRLLTMAAERLNEKSHEKVMGLLRAGDPRGAVTACYNAKEAVRELYTVPDYELAGVFIDELIRDMNDPSWPVEVRSLGRTLKRWRGQIIAWHQAHFSNECASHCTSL